MTPRIPVGFTRQMLQRSPPADQLQNENYQRNQQQDVNVSAQNVEPDKAEQPQNQQNHKYSPKHNVLSVEVVDLRSFGQAHPRVTNVGRHLSTFYLPAFRKTVRRSQLLCSNCARAVLKSTSVNSATMRAARSRNFALVVFRSIIKLPRTLPSLTIAPVLMMFSATFVAVPAFKRVEPVKISGPTARSIPRWTSTLSSRAALQVSKIVFAPNDFARRSAPSTNGVRPLAVIPTTTSASLTPRRSIASAPLLVSSSAPSTLRWSAVAPPAIMPCTNSGEAPNVGGISLASSTPRRPLVPAPT